MSKKLRWLNVKRVLGKRWAIFLKRLEQVERENPKTIRLTHGRNRKDGKP